MSARTEGVTKFAARHADGPLPPAARDLLPRLAAWRAVLFELGLVGQDAARYDGAGYGNVSARVGPFPGARGARAFVVSGTQTGGQPCIDAGAFCVVRRYDAVANTVDSVGPARPSSESLTHGAVYDLGPHVRAVLHGHCPVVWRARAAIRLPTTPDAVAYGTPAMAHAVGHLARSTALLDGGVFAMGGHEDGVVAFGRGLDEAGAALLRVVVAARARAFGEAGVVCSPER